MVQQLRLKLKSLLRAVLGRLATLCCCSWRDGHVPNVNKRHAGGPKPACDPAPLSLHILALCLDCIRGLCWSMPLSRSILSSMRLNLSPYFADASWERGGRVRALRLPATYFLCCSAADENTPGASEASDRSKRGVLWITGQTGLTGSTKKKQSF